MTAQEELAFVLRAVLVDPSDTLARLAYADAMEEAGDAFGANLVRYQVRAVGPNCVAWDLGLAWTFRGYRFIDEISLPTAAFLEHAYQLFSAHPIVRVVLKDRKPYLASQYLWHRTIPFMDDDYHWHIPPCIFDQLANKHATVPTMAWYYGSDDALNDLSRACVAYGRNLVGLSPLPQSGQRI